MLWVVVGNPFRKTFTATICGHKTKIAGPIASFGETSIMQMPLNKEGETEYCLDCIAKMAIRCAWCGKPINIGSAVTLYIPTSKTYIPPEHAVRHEEDERCLVGCLRWDCADTGADMQGYWVPPGKVARCLSPVELALRGNVVLVPDVSQYPNGVVTIPHES